jgi:hypothetical protein
VLWGNWVMRNVGNAQSELHNAHPLLTIKAHA